MSLPRFTSACLSLFGPPRLFPRLPFFLASGNVKPVASGCVTSDPFGPSIRCSFALGSSVSDPLDRPAVALGPRIVASGGFDLLYREGMSLIEDVAGYLDGDGRHESRGLHFTLDYPQTDRVPKDTVLVP